MQLRIIATVLGLALAGTIGQPILAYDDRPDIAEDLPYHSMTQGQAQLRAVSASESPAIALFGVATEAVRYRI